MAETGLDAILHRSQSSQRVPLSCSECARRKIRCDKQIPCKACTLRGAAQTCQRSIPLDTRAASNPATSTPRLAAGGVTSAIIQLQRRVDELERRLGPEQRGEDVSFDAAGSSTRDVLSPTSPVSTSTTTGAAHTIVNGDENVDQAVTYEYLALGKDRNRGILGPPSRHLHTDHAPSSNILGQPRQIPLDNSIIQALLPPRALDYVLTFADDVVAWQHACVHLPTFHQQVDAFMEISPSEQRWRYTDPLWLALFFVIQSIAVHQMNPADSSTMSILGVSTPQQQSIFTGKLLDAALKCFEAGRYLFEPSFFTCQAIAILCVCGHNVTDSNLLSSLLAIGIKTAQSLNLHVLGGEDTRMRMAADSEIYDTTSQMWKNRVLSLEMAKRVWWSLVQQDYLAIPFRGVSTVHSREHDTPIPSNLDDEDIVQGRTSPRPDSELTLVSKLRFTSRAADAVCHFFQGLPRDSREGIATLKSHVEPYEMRLLGMLPNKTTSQLRSLNPSFQFGAAIRRYLNVSLRHKVLVLHRAFCSRDTISETEKYVSQERCIEMSRQILEHCRTMQNSSRPEGQVNAVWTISYHAVAAACVLGLQLFPSESIKQTKSLRVSRKEVEQAQGVLLMLGERSSIAARGVEMLSRLLERYDESQDGPSSRKRARQDYDDDSTQNIQSDDTSLNGQNNTSPSATFYANTFETEHYNDYNSILSMLDTMPDVYRLFDGSLGQPFTNDFNM